MRFDHKTMQIGAIWFLIMFALLSFLIGFAVGSLTGSPIVHWMNS